MNLLLTATTAIIAYFLNLIFVPLLIRISHSKQWYDQKDHRKIHEGNISRLGGIGIFSAFILSSFISPIVVGFFTEIEISQFSGGVSRFPVVLSVIIIFVIGLLDDFSEMRAIYKLIGQILVALLVCWGGAVISKITIPFFWIDIELGIFTWPVTIIWIIGITNAINLIDGIDGLSSIISLLAAGFYGIIFTLNGDYFLALIAFSVMGSILGYLFYNFPPADIFMGDSGSLFLGLILAVLPLLVSPSSGTSLVMPITLLALPIGDVFIAIIRRKRKGLHFFTPDRGHMHHKMMDAGLSNRIILAIISLQSIIFGFAVISFNNLPNHKGFWFILGAWIIALGFLVLLHSLVKNDSSNKKSK